MILTKLKDLIPAPKDAPNLGGNLLRQTQFVSGLMDQWYTATGEIITNGFDGHNVCHFIVSQTLGQYVQGSGHEILMPATVYTISFWSKGVIFIDINPGDTGEAYAVYDRAFGRWIDGVKESDYVNDFGYLWEDSDWTYHTYTFKTAAAFDGSLANLYWHSPSWLSASTGCWLCMPKLERGDNATAYVANDEDLKGVSGTNIYYKADSSTPSTPSGAPASNPSWADNGNSLITNSNATKHLYESTCTTYTDGTYSWSTPIDDGLIQDMASTAEQFALADSGTTAPSSGWNTSVTPTAGKWVWSRTVLTFKDGSTKVINTQCVGYCGTNGKGISSADIMFCLGDSQTQAPGDSSFTVTTFAGLNISSTDANKFVWQCIKTTYTSGDPTYSGKVCLGKVSDFASVVEQYALGSASAATSSWQDNTPPSAEKGKYLWTRTKLTYSGSGTTYIPSEAGQCVGYFGNDGTTGYSIALTLIRNNLYTDANWNTYAELGHSENYSKRTGDSDFTACRESDYFVVTGTSSDSGKNHTAIYKCTSVNANSITGTCVSHTKDGNKGDDAQYIYLKGSAYNKDSAGTNVAASEIKVNGGSNLATQSRGLCLVTLNRQTLAVVDSATIYDTYEGTTGKNNLITKLNNLGTNVFVCLVSYDAIGWSDTLISTLQSFGMSDLPYTSENRYPFLFIGYKNLGKGNGITRMNDMAEPAIPVELGVYVANGALSVKDGKDGEDGDDVFSVSLDRSSLTCETSDGDLTQDYDFYITIYAYYGTTNVLSDCSVTATCPDTDIEVNVMNDKRVRVRTYEDMGLAAVTPVNITVTHSTYGSRTLVCNITRVERGSRGNRGPQLRGPQLYSAVPSNFQFYKGADYEEFVDVVIDDNGNYYKCKQSHIKSSGVGPGTAGWENYWSLGTKFDIVATKILLATYALIKNLGVENVEAKDANNNTIFSVRNGVLVCNGGTIGGFKISSSRIGADDVDVNNFLWIESNGKIRIVRTGSGNALDVLGNIILNGNGGTFTLNNASNNGTIQLVGRLKADTGYLKTSSDTLNSGDIYRDANGYLRIKT